MPVQFSVKAVMHIDRGAEVCVRFVAADGAPEQTPPLDELTGAASGEEPLAFRAASGAVL